MEMVWQMKLLEMCLPCSGRLQHYQQKKLYLVSRSETLFPSVWHNSVCCHVPSSGN